MRILKFYHERERREESVLHDGGMHGAHVEMRGQPCGLVSLSTFTWVPGIKFKSPGYHGKSLYPLSHPRGPYWNLKKTTQTGIFGQES